MKTLILFVAWWILFALAWPVALLVLVLVLVLWPVAWLLALPLRVAAIAVEAALALGRAVLMLPARLLGHRGS